MSLVVLHVSLFIFQGLVFVNGANVLDANDSKSLYEIFEKGSENRHVASTSELSGTNLDFPEAEDLLTCVPNCLV